MMEVFRQEMKKIWRPGILLALVVIGVVYFWLWPSYYARHFGSSYTYDRYYCEATAELVRCFGPELEPEERDELVSMLGEAEAELNAELAAIPECVELGITDFDSAVRAVDWPENDTDYQTGELILNSTSYVRVSRIAYALNELDNIDTTREGYLNQRYDRSSEAQFARVEEVYFDMDSVNLLPTYAAIFEYPGMLAVWCVLSITLLLSPVLVRDRLRRVRQMQWSSRCGRRVLGSQFAAGIVSALFLAVVNIALYALPHIIRNHMLLYLNCPMNDSPLWVDLSYGQYLLVLCALELIISLSAAVLTLFLSQYSGNYISMLLKAIPLFVVLGPLLATRLLDTPLHVFGRRGQELGSDILLTMALIALSISLCAAALHRQKRRELTE